MSPAATDGKSDTIVRVISLREQDNIFFEEYKRLDRLCADMYEGRNGVSAYIADMDEEAGQGQLWVLGWSEDYKKLKHVRWVRNQIAHDSAAYQRSEPADLQFVKEFYSRVLSGRDPLTQLRKIREHKKKQSLKKPPKRQQEQARVRRPQPPERPKKRGAAAIILIVLGLALLLLTLYLRFPTYF